MDNPIVIAVVSAVVGGVIVTVADVFRDGVKARRDRRGHDHDIARRVELTELVDVALAPIRNELVDLRDEVGGLTGLIAGGVHPDRRNRHPREDRP